MNLNREIISAVAILAGTACAISAPKSDGWNIFAPVTPAAYSGATVANGRIGVISSPEIMRNSRMILSGVEDQTHRGDIIRLIEGWNMLDMELIVDNTSISTSDVTDFNQTLSLRNSSMESSFTLPGKLTATYNVTPLGGSPNSVIAEVSFTAQKDVDIELVNRIATPSGYRLIDTERPYFRTVDGLEIEMLSALAATPWDRMTVGVASGFVLDPQSNPVITRKQFEFTDSTAIAQGVTFSMKKGSTVTLTLAGAMYHSGEVTLPQRSAERAVCTLELEGTAPALARHNAYWDKMWEGDIIIDGPLEEQQDVRYMLYSIYSSVVPDSSASPSPFGLSHTYYSGHVFWDTDLWMYPPMLIMNPGVASSMANYRADRLDAAKANYIITGGRCFYPWESDRKGEEQTPLSATTGVQEIHVSACVALAMWQYFQTTGDLEWLRTKGYPVIEATARFWTERAKKEDDGRWHIRNVVGADEFAENVDDNAFTNAAAKKNLRVAAQGARRLGVTPDPKWEEIAEGMAFHTLPNGVTAEYRDYDGKLAKQADVNLLAYPLGEITDEAQIAKDLEYYASAIGLNTSPAMTEAIFSILYSQLGRWDDAEKYYNESYKRNCFGGFRGIAECKGGTLPYFITGAGGALQAVIMGYGGVRITDDGITATPRKDVRLPNGWKSLTIIIPGHEPVKVTSAK